MYPLEFIQQYLPEYATRRALFDQGRKEMPPDLRSALFQVKYFQEALENYTKIIKGEKE